MISQSDCKKPGQGSPMTISTYYAIVLKNIRTAALMQEPNRVRSVQRAKVRIFSALIKQLVDKSFIITGFPHTLENLGNLENLENLENEKINFQAWKSPGK